MFFCLSSSYNTDFLFISSTSALLIWLHIISSFLGDSVTKNNTKFFKSTCVIFHIFPQAQLIHQQFFLSYNFHLLFPIHTSVLCDLLVSCDMSVSAVLINKGSLPIFSYISRWGIIPVHLFLYKQ